MIPNKNILFTITAVLLSLLIALPIVFWADNYDDERKKKKDELDESYFNSERDKFINNLLNSKPIKTEVHRVYLFNFVEGNLYYDTLKITIIYHPAIPYEQPESWEYYGRLKNGNLYHMNPCEDCDWKLRPETYKYLQKLFVGYAPVALGINNLTLIYPNTFKRKLKVNLR